MISSLVLWHMKGGVVVGGGMLVKRNKGRSSTSLSQLRVMGVGHSDWGGYEGGS